ncbi:MAG: hypothetical protein ABFS05_06390 [Bacteroidota bacterium]
MNTIFRVVILFICSLYLSGVHAQSREGLIKLELVNYMSKESLNQVVGEGTTLDGKPHGEWAYYLLYDHNIMYCKGHYLKGIKTGVWNNYAILPPMGYADNYELVRSTEVYKDGKLYRYKMGQDNLLILIKNGLEEPYITELRRLDEAFENSYRRTHGKTITPEFGESVESIQSRVIPMIRTELLKSKQKAELKFWTLYHKLKLHEEYDSGKIIKRLSQQWEKNVLFSKEIYENEMLKEKYLYMEGDPSNIMEYLYYDNGDLHYIRHYVNDTVPSGRWIENYPNGEKKFQGNYSSGKRNGKWKFWDETGAVEVVKYKDGIKD